MNTLDELKKDYQQSKESYDRLFAAVSDQLEQLQELRQEMDAKQIALNKAQSKVIREYDLALEERVAQVLDNPLIALPLDTFLRQKEMPDVTTYNVLFASSSGKLIEKYYKYLEISVVIGEPLRKVLARYPANSYEIKRDPIYGDSHLVLLTIHFKVARDLLSLEGSELYSTHLLFTYTISQIKRVLTPESVYVIWDKNLVKE